MHFIITTFSLKNQANWNEGFMQAPSVHTVSPLLSIFFIFRLDYSILDMFFICSLCNSQSIKGILLIPNGCISASQKEHFCVIKRNISFCCKKMLDCLKT